MPDNTSESQYGGQSAKIGGIGMNLGEAALMSSSGRAAQKKRGKTVQAKQWVATSSGAGGNGADMGKEGQGAEVLEGQGKAEGEGLSGYDRRESKEDVETTHAK